MTLYWLMPLLLVAKFCKGNVSSSFFRVDGELPTTSDVPIINQETMKCARENSCKQVARTPALPVNHSNETNGKLNATLIKMEGSYSHSPLCLVTRTLVLLIFVALRGKKCDKMYFTPFYNSTLDFAIHFTEFNSKFCATVQQNSYQQSILNYRLSLQLESV